MSLVAILSERFNCDSVIIPIFLGPDHFWPFNIFQVSFLEISCPSLIGWILFSFELFVLLCIIWNCVYFRPKRNYFKFPNYVPVLYGSFFILLSAVVMQVSCGFTLLHPFVLHWPSFSVWRWDVRVPNKVKLFLYEKCN